MRVVGGTARGRRLQSPPGTTVRPTSDRAREAIFNSLTSMGVLDDAVVLDLFAGSGALGIEALSRGASAATFVERERVALGVIRANLAALGFEGRVVQGDAVAHAALVGPVDVAFVDPPYAFDQWDELLAHLDAQVAVLEADHPIAVADGWEVLKVKRFGGTVVTVVQPTSSPAS
jgi:16S rRNA (guanine966-N2)-methyltransferase